MAVVVYQLRVNLAESRLENRLVHIQQLQQALQPQPKAYRQPSPEEVAAHQRRLKEQAEENQRIAAAHAIAAAEGRRKEEAWSRYFTPTRACMLPESNARQQVCEANRSKHRARFEENWVANKKT
ncbi:hypothetical protein [Pseudomonas sp. 8BK]|uniref:hypothetical protein n=1 Tax=Pseudomonas sp. 8BK TaxID=2653164 RepID=UPI001359BE2F|nr:hypothetical protein [Pseudomonas sp. 8BK]